MGTHLIYSSDEYQHRLAPPPEICMIIMSMCDHFTMRAMRNTCKLFHEIYWDKKIMINRFQKKLDHLREIQKKSVHKCIKFASSAGCLYMLQRLKKKKKDIDLIVRTSVQKNHFHVLRVYIYDYIKINQSFKSKLNKIISLEATTKDKKILTFLLDIKFALIIENSN